MHIRCFCGNDTMLHDAEDGRPVLYDRAWYDEEEKRIRCPKCKSDALAIALDGEAPAEGPLPVVIDSQAAFAKRRTELARQREAEATEAAAAAATPAAPEAPAEPAKPAESAVTAVTAPATPAAAAEPPRENSADHV